MKTNELVKILSKESLPNSPRWTMRSALGYWFIGSVMIFILSVWLLPVREDLTERLQNVDFFFLSMLWGVTAFLSTKLSILSTFPEEKIFRRKEVYVLFALFGALGAWMLFRVPTENIGFHLYREKSVVNGGCGMVIFVCGVLHSALTLSFFRKGASTQSRRTGALIALSTGAFSTFLIQFACANEHPFHVFMWHILPLMGLSYLMSRVAPRVLQW